MQLPNDSLTFLVRYRSIGTLMFAITTLWTTACSSTLFAADQPNIVILFSDDISARELPLYGSSVWSPPTGGDTSEPNFRANTPVLDQLARDGCWIKTAWASVVCSPSRAMMMTGRYAHLHKWWGNKSKGKYIDENGKKGTWPLYESCPTLIGHVAGQAGYKSYWSGKTQMAGYLTNFGFDQGCFTPGNLQDKDNPYTDFKHIPKKVNGEKVLINADTDLPVDTYWQHGWYWFPHVRLMNHGDKDFQWWPNTPETVADFGVNTYGPDVELDFIFDFMEQQVEAKQPFFVYHCSHLGHDAFNWLDPDSTSKWPGTPVIRWEGHQYTRTDPNITGDGGKYDTHGTVTESGIHHHVNYLDYQVWLYRKKLKELGIADNTVFVFCSDNGTSGYGKNSTDRQKGTHVPMIISAPDLTKKGEQDVLVNLSDFLPTIAELAGVELPEDYEINGKSLVPYLFGNETTHRDWLYGYRDNQQIIRGTKVMRDGRGKWWDVSTTPEDLISFDKIDDWDSVSQEHRAEREKLLAIFPRFSQEVHGRDGPGIKQVISASAPMSKSTKPRQEKSAEGKAVLFEDDFEGRQTLGDKYVNKDKTGEAWTISDGVLHANQVNPNHGSVMRKQMKFNDLDVEFDFRFNGGKSFNFVVDDNKEKSVHAGHICRVSVFKRGIMVGDDKTGAMNLEVRAQRKDPNLDGKEKEALEQQLKHTRANAKAKIKSGQWHKLRVQISGNKMRALLDGNLAVEHTSPGFAHPEKTQFGMTVNGSTIDFDNLKVYETE